MALTGRRVVWTPPIPTVPTKRAHVLDRRILAPKARRIQATGARIVRRKGV